MARRPPRRSGVARRRRGGRRPPGRGHARWTTRWCAALAAAHEARHRASRPCYGGVPGATDGTILTRDAGLATVVYGPGGKWIAHQADEFVEVADIVRCARGLRRGGPALPRPGAPHDRRRARDRPTASPTSPASGSGTPPARGDGWLTGTTVVLAGPAAPSAGSTCAAAARAPGRPTCSTRATPSSASHAVVPHRRQRVRAGRGRRRDARPGRRRRRLPGGPGRARSCRSCRRGDLRPRPWRRLRQPARRGPRRRGATGPRCRRPARGRCRQGGRRRRHRRQRRAAQGRHRLGQRGARRRHHGRGAGRGQPGRLDRRPRDRRAVRRPVRPATASSPRWQHRPEADVRAARDWAAALPGPAAGRARRCWRRRSASSPPTPR